MSKHDPLEVERHEKSTWETAANIYADTAGLLTALSGQAELIKRDWRDCPRQPRSRPGLRPWSIN